MIKGSGIIINGETFRTKAEAVERVRGILRCYTEDTRLLPPDCTFVLALLERHPSADQKIGAGVLAIGVFSPPPWHKNKGFFIERVDGTRTDFSFLECLSPSSNWTKVQRACRAAVVDQVLDFKNESFQLFGNGGRIACAITGELVTAADCHIDHEPPFLVIVQRFFESAGLDPAAIRMAPTGDNVTYDSFEDPGLALRFAEFHRINAGLRIVSKAANLGRKRKDGAA